MYEAVKAKKIPCALVVFEGEQHGFRKAENIQRALNSEVGEKRSDREEKGNWGILRWKSVGAEYIYMYTGVSVRSTCVVGRYVIAMHHATRVTLLTPPSPVFSRPSSSLSAIVLRSGVRL